MLLGRGRGRGRILVEGSKMAGEKEEQRKGKDSELCQCCEVVRGEAVAQRGGEKSWALSQGARGGQEIVLDQEGQDGDQKGQDRDQEGRNKDQKGKDEDQEGQDGDQKSASQADQDQEAH